MGTLRAFGRFAAKDDTLLICSAKTLKKKKKTNKKQTHAKVHKWKIHFFPFFSLILLFYVLQSLVRL